MRAFVALELPEGFANEVAGMARALSASVEGRFLGRDTYHVTLAFLGDIAEADVAHVMDVLDDACDTSRAAVETLEAAGVTAAEAPGAAGAATADNHGAGMPSVPLAPEGLGKFGRASDATLWLGLAKAAPLMALAETVREGLRARGIAFDDKPFLPHITLARRARLPKGPLPPLAFPLPTDATAVTLFKSTLDREGATYKPLYSRDLPQLH